MKSAATGRLRKLLVAALLIGVLSASTGAAAFTVATVSTGHSGSIPTAGPSSTQNTMGGPGGGGRGGPGDDATGSTALTELLDATSTRWSAAVIGDQSAAGYILAGDTAVMAIGGWSGSDPAPTLEQFQQYVADGEVTYFIAGGNGGGGRGGAGDSEATRITAWVEATFTATTVGGATVYDLTR